MTHVRLGMGNEKDPPLILPQNREHVLKPWRYLVLTLCMLAILLGLAAIVTYFWTIQKAGVPESVEMRTEKFADGKEIIYASDYNKRLTTALLPSDICVLMSIDTNVDGLMPFHEQIPIPDVTFLSDDAQQLCAGMNVFWMLSKEPTHARKKRGSCSGLNIEDCIGSPSCCWSPNEVCTDPYSSKGGACS